MNIEGEVNKILASYGPNEVIRSGPNTVVVLPTCTVPIDDLNEERWASSTPLGNTRNVVRIKSLKDDRKPGIIVKSPERAFTSSPQRLEKGDVWWGGPRSREKPVFLPNSQVVEEQAVWEAITLLELRRQGVRAEIPQALIQDSEGKMRLVVKEITPPKDINKRNGPCWNDIFAKIAQTGLVPVDSGGHNWLPDEEGYTNLIDTNRWTWSPHSDNYRQRLVAEVATAAFVTTQASRVSVLV